MEQGCVFKFRYGTECDEKTSLSETTGVARIETIINMTTVPKKASRGSHKKHRPAELQEKSPMNGENWSSIFNKVTLKRPQKEKHHQESCAEQNKCSFCLFTCEGKTKLEQHLKNHFTKRPFNCTFCEKLFEKMCHLKKHEESHTSEKPIQCSVCNTSFVNLFHLERHNVMHRGEKANKGTSSCWKDMDNSTLNVVQSRVWPDDVQDFEGFSEMGNEELARPARSIPGEGFENMNRDDVQERLLVHRQKSTNEEPMELALATRDVKEEKDESELESDPSMTNEDVIKLYELLREIKHHVETTDANLSRANQASIAFDVVDNLYHDLFLITQKHKKITDFRSPITCTFTDEPASPTESLTQLHLTASEIFLINSLH
uniref:C2H2-type domain-containing protein n=1 Tax=Eptatretus burgeri TaxID=7764 RepID=A0A8C4QWK8_EPTBU